MVTGFNERRFQDTVEAVHAAAIDAARWPDALEGIRGFFAGTAVVAFASEVGTGELLDIVSVGTADNADDEYQAHYWRQDPKLAFARTHPGLPLYHDFQCMTESEMDRNGFYRWQERVGGLRYCFGASAPVDREAFGQFAVHWSRRHGPPQRDEADMFIRCSAHVQTAIAVNRRMAHLPWRDEAGWSALDLLPRGLLVLDAGGRVLAANRAAETILAAGDGLIVEDGALRAGRAAEDQALQRHLGCATGASSAVAPIGGALALPRPSGARPYGLLVTPYAGRRPRFATRPPAVIVTVTDPEQEVEPSTDMLRRLFGLTPTEAALAARLATGRGLDEVADELTMAKATARVHLRKIFKKTRVSRQSELVRLVLDSPARTREPDDM